MAAEPVKVAIVPFQINAEKDMSFLRDGIYDMLASRLAWEGKVVVLGREVSENAFTAVAGPIEAPAARDIGARIGAKWVLFGSLTLFGNSVSIDTKMVDVCGVEETLSFFNQSEGMEEVIPRINLIAQDINAQVFGRRTAVAGPAGPGAPSPSRPGPPSTPTRRAWWARATRTIRPLSSRAGPIRKAPGSGKAATSRPKSAACRWETSTATAKSKPCWPRPRRS